MLRRTLVSLAAQNYDNIGVSEVLIIDNNCSDETVNVVKEFQERRRGETVQAVRSLLRNTQEPTEA